MCHIHGSLHDPRQKGDSALILASYFGKTVACTALLGSGASVDFTNKVVDEVVEYFLLVCMCACVLCVDMVLRCCSRDAPSLCRRLVYSTAW